MLIFVILSVPKIGCCYAECHYSVCLELDFVMLSVIILSVCIAGCCYAECHYSQCV